MNKARLRLVLGPALFLAATVATVSIDGCATPAPGGSDMAGKPDMKPATCKDDPPANVDGFSPPSGQVVKPGDIGTACAKTTDCKQGTAPVCWATNILNNTNIKILTPGGYCSSTCKMHSDCGPNNICVNFGTQIGAFCFGGCADPVTCRHGADANNPDYTCSILGVDQNNNLIGVCMPPVLNGQDCNPKQAACTTSDTMVPGGCSRQAYEDGLGGTCMPTCNPGDACDPDAAMNPQQCLYWDFTQDGDAFRGLICSPSAMAPLDAGAACMNTFDCIDGYQCDNGTGGTNKCQELCNLNGKAPKCKAGMTCQKAFPTCAAGLCR